MRRVWRRLDRGWHDFCIGGHADAHPLPPTPATTLSPSLPYPPLHTCPAHPHPPCLDAVTNKLPVRELLAAVDPLITPFVAPVIEGIKQPIYLKLEEVEKQVVSSFVITAASCLVGGFLLGRLSRGGGSGSGGDVSSGGKGRGRR